MCFYLGNLNQKICRPYAQHGRGNKQHAYLGVALEDCASCKFERPTTFLQDVKASPTVTNTINPTMTGLKPFKDGKKAIQLSYKAQDRVTFGMHKAQPSCFHGQGTFASEKLPDDRSTEFRGEDATAVPFHGFNCVIQRRHLGL